MILTSQKEKRSFPMMCCEYHAERIPWTNEIIISSPDYARFCFSPTIIQLNN